MVAASAVITTATTTTNTTTIATIVPANANHGANAVHCTSIAQKSLDRCTLYTYCFLHRTMAEPKRADPSGWSNSIAQRAANEHGSSASGSQWAQPASSTPLRPPLPLTAIRLKDASHGHSQRGYQGDAVYHVLKSCAAGTHPVVPEILMAERLRTNRRGDDTAKLPE